MFGKGRDHPALLDASPLDDIFGDEATAARAAGIDELRDRMERAESHIASQFTSLAAYAQIAQEHVERVRAEARTAVERSEQRVISLIERERDDRMVSQGVAPSGSMPDVAARLDAVEHLVARIQHGLDECRQQQLALATAITAMFDRLTPSTTNDATATECLTHPYDERTTEIPVVEMQNTKPAPFEWTPTTELSAALDEIEHNTQGARTVAAPTLDGPIDALTLA